MDKTFNRRNESIIVAYAQTAINGSLGLISWTVNGVEGEMVDRRIRCSADPLALYRPLFVEESTKRTRTLRC